LIAKSNRIIKTTASMRFHRLSPIAILFILIGVVAYALAGPTPAYCDDFHAEMPDEIPSALKGVGIDDHLGSAVSIHSLKFRDESGKAVALEDYFHAGRPVLLTLVYYECPNLCNFVLNGLVNTLREMDWKPGKQFEIVAVSIDPREGPDLAARKKAAYLASYRHPETASGWHFLTALPEQNLAAPHRSGPPSAEPPTNSSISGLAHEVGFGYRWAGAEYAHGAAVYVLTPEGRISRYLNGIEFPQTGLRLSLLEASSGKIGSIVDRVLLFCYHYDPQSRKYSLVIMRVMQVGCVGTVILGLLYLLVFWDGERRRVIHSMSAGLDPASQKKGV
jgi:protein SCO1